MTTKKKTVSGTKTETAEGVNAVAKDTPVSTLSQGSV